MIIVVDESDAGKRLDMYLASNVEDDLSRTKIKKYIKDGCVRVNDESVSPSYALRLGDNVEYVFPAIVVTADHLQPENIPLDVIFEDEDILIINKQSGLVVHPGAGNPSHTLVNALKFYLGDSLSSCAGEERCGIVHRLDKDTSGVMVIAKNDFAHKKISNQSNTILEVQLN